MEMTEHTGFKWLEDDAVPWGDTIMDGWMSLPLGDSRVNYLESLIMATPGGLRSIVLLEYLHNRPHHKQASAMFIATPHGNRRIGALKELSGLGIYVPLFADVKFVGLRGSLAYMNGTHRIAIFESRALAATWGGDGWNGYFGWNPRLHTANWVVRVTTPSTYCYKTWQNTNDPNDPEIGAFTELDCDEGWSAFDVGTCAASAGATCKVRWTGLTWP